MVSTIGNQSQVEEPTQTLNSCYPFSPVWLYRNDLYLAYTIAIVIEGVLVIPTTIENFLVIVGIWKTRPLHSPANFLICVLALSDFGVGLLALPFHLASNSFALRKEFVPWCVTTRIAYGFGVHLAAVSLLTITAISVERVIALYWALRYELLATNTKVIIFVVLSWPAMALLSMVQYFDMDMYKVMAAVISFICFAVSSIGCFKIYQVVRHHRTQIGHQESISNRHATPPSTDQPRKSVCIAKRKKSSFSMLCLYGLFVLCYTPYVCVQLAMLFGAENSLVYAGEITTVSIVFANSVLNPLLYCWRMRDIRRAMMAVFPCKNHQSERSSRLETWNQTGHVQ